MVRFHGLFDDKIMVRKTSFFLVFVWKGSVFLQKARRALSNWAPIFFKKTLQHDKVSYNSTY